MSLTATQPHVVEMRPFLRQDRLVEYDRNAAKRTAVIDDQSDFFEIDSNAWLTPEVQPVPIHCITQVQDPIPVGFGEPYD